MRVKTAVYVVVNDAIASLTRYYDLSFVVSERRKLIATLALSAERRCPCSHPRSPRGSGPKKFANQQAGTRATC